MSVASSFPAVVLTPGEPAGIGPDLVVALSQTPLPCRLAVAADPGLIASRAQDLNVRVRFIGWHNQPHQPGLLQILEVPSLAAPVHAGVLEPANAQYVLSTLDRAVDCCLAGMFDALVTGPIHKGAINDAGISFSGHTEYLAHRTCAPTPVMLLVADDLRVALATTHMPMADVSRHLQPERLEQLIRVLVADLAAKFGIAEPRISVCGLNPHAGEGGHLGREEIDVIAPVIARLRREGMQLRGPVPADTAFTPPQLKRTDVVLAMYHDQGLPVLKHYGFGRGVNCTLGLPIIRTSVDHGTALQLAGTGNADCGSLLAAVRLAIKLAAHRETVQLSRNAAEPT